MQITSLRIRNFRSIDDLICAPKDITAICGTNSSGKSNLLRALRLAFRIDIDTYKLSENVSNWAGPNTLCTIEITFNKPTKELYTISPEIFPKDTPFLYKFTFKKSGSISRYINGVKLNESLIQPFIDSILVIYVPAIRDIDADGLKPFRDTLLGALKKQNRGVNLNSLNSSLRSQIAQRGKSMLANTRTLAKDWMQVESLDVDTSTIAVDSLLSKVGIRVRTKNDDFELAKLGTGQQLSLIHISEPTRH